MTMRHVPDHVGDVAGWRVSPLTRERDRAACRVADAARPARSSPIGAEWSKPLAMSQGCRPSWPPACRSRRVRSMPRHSRRRGRARRRRRYRSPPRADGDDQLDLVVEVSVVAADRAYRRRSITSASAGFDEEERRLGVGVVPHLARVLGIVAADAEDAAHRESRRRPRSGTEATSGGKTKSAMDPSRLRATP